jgi:hypothetical protein
VTVHVLGLIIILPTAQNSSSAPLAGLLSYMKCWGSSNKSSIFRGQERL